MSSGSVISILIESQWNLNNTHGVRQVTLYHILIESQWNLNTKGI